MYVRRLTLSDFRNYRRLELELPAGALLFIGENAQGKTNLLEAVYLLSTIRSPRTTSDSELVNWDATAESATAAARIVVDAERRGGPVRVEMAVQAASGDPANGPQRAIKRLRVDGAPKRASEAVGRINSVFFTPQDLDLIGGPPSLRRRYLDMTLSQVDPRYLAALQEYVRVVTQRNALLRRIREGQSSVDELAFWDGEMTRNGAYIAGTRARTIEQLATLAREAQEMLSGEREELGLAYEPRWAADWGARRLVESDESAAASALLTTLERGRRREVAAGVSLWGPHRDDLLFLLDGRSAAAYASRAQRRTAALALRLAEARYLTSTIGEHPVLLLDDVLSEMDERRRRGVLEAIEGFDQVWITSAEGDVAREAVAATIVFEVRAGEVVRS